MEEPSEHRASFSQPASASLTINDAGQIVYCSKTLHAITGRSAANRRTTYVTRLFPELSDADLTSAQSYILETGRPARLSDIALGSSKDDLRLFSVTGYPAGANQITLILEDITDQEALKRALHDSESRLRQLTESIHEVVWVRTPHRFLYVNPAYERVFGATVQSLYDDPKSFLECIHPDDRNQVERSFLKDIPGNHHFRETYRVKRKDGSVRWVYSQRYPINDPEFPGRSAGTVTDITLLKEFEHRLRRNERLLSLAQRIAGLGHWETDLVRNVTQWSDEAYRIFGLTQQGSRGLEKTDFFGAVHPEDRGRVEEALKFALAAPGNLYRVEHRIIRPGGEERYILQQGEVTFGADNRPLKMVGTLLDITDRRDLEKRLRRLATTDSLTGLLNRREFTRRGDQEVRRMARHGGRQACLLMMDLDRFKRVNDTWGHAVGDRVLTGMSRKLASLVRAHDLVSRLGGEEFAVLLVEADLTQGRRKAEQIRAALAEETYHNDTGDSFNVTVSIGCAPVDPSVDDPLSRALSQADRGLYQAKAGGRNQVAVA